MKKQWSRDNRVLLAIGVALGAALTGLYAVVQNAESLTPAAATNRVVLFVLFYIVVLLILALVFVLARSAVKLVVDSRRGVFGSRFRVRVVATNVGLALLPIALLVLPTTGLLQRSVEFWFRPPVRETVRAGHRVVEIVRQRGAALERQAGARLEAALPQAASEAARFALLSTVRAESGLDFIEWLPDGKGGTAAVPLAVSTPRWPVREAAEPPPDWIADARSRGLARHIEQTGDGGQVNRTLAAVPGGVLILGSFEPPEESGPIRALSRATSTYEMLEAERSSLEAVQVLLFLLLAFVVLLAAVWVGLLLARQVTRPIAALAASARRVGAGDFDALVDVEGGDEIGALSGAFNTMTNELRASRERLVTAGDAMADTNRRLDEERRRMKTILAHLQAGVVAFSESGRLLATNDTARRLLGTEPGAEPATLDELLSSPALSRVRSFLLQAVEPGGSREITLSVVLPEKTWILDVRVAEVPAQSGEGSSWVVTLEDTTALVSAERAAAWEEAARRMAHEIKNPLTPIRLAAERMRRRARSARPSGDADRQELTTIVEEGASTIVEEVGTLAALVDAFGRFARLPPAELAATDLTGVVQQVVKLYDGTKPGVRVRANLPETLPLVMADAEQVKRALINLVDNAVTASVCAGTVVIEAAVNDGVARLVVADDGPGIPPKDRGRVFDPAYSTKPRGTGLGLAITARIAAEHAGRVTLEDNAPRGCRFVLEWPA